MRDWIDYSKPQENGNKTNVRWFELINGKESGLRFKSVKTLSVNALPFSNDSIESAEYSWHLPKPQNIYLSIDHKQMGVGADNSWGATCHDEYLLRDKKYSYTYRVSPVVRGH
ncbi:MAG: hypothetical protein MI748_05845 [Opitutales bacterium]|nr:hypothetical protein [Opitutales bacterium]